MDTKKHLTNEGGYTLLEILIAGVLGAFVLTAAVGSMHNLFYRLFTDFQGSDRVESIRAVQWITKVAENASDITIDGDNLGFTARLDYTESSSGTIVWQLNNTPDDTSDDTYVRVAIADDSKIHYLTNVGSAPALPTSSDPELSALTATGAFGLFNSNNTGNATELQIGLTMGSAPTTQFANYVLARNMPK